MRCFVVIGPTFSGWESRWSAMLVMDEEAEKQARYAGADVIQAGEPPVR